MTGGLTKAVLKTLDRIAPARGAPHLLTGRRGEEEAYFYLRNLGYVMVARNWRSARRRGEIDLIGWDKDVLCFVEVKTRAARALVAGEAAVDSDKQRELSGMARDYLRRVQPMPAVRCDVLSIYVEAGGGVGDMTLFKDAFSLW